MIDITKIGIAIGNGTSREGFDLEGLRKHNAPIVGCNFIFRDFIPDVVVAFDQATGVIEEIESLKSRNWKWLQRVFNGSEQLLYLDDEYLMKLMEANGPYSTNAGIVACAYLARVLKCEKIYMIGFDLFRETPDKINNIYHGDNKYSIGAGIHNAFNLLVERNPDTKFIRVGKIKRRDRRFFGNDLKGFTYMDELPEEL